MCEDQDPMVLVIAAEIVAHLRSHPQAADSASGVGMWWLGPGCAQATAFQVERALEALVDAGAMRRLKMLDGSALYSEAVPAPAPTQLP